MLNSACKIVMTLLVQVWCRAPLSTITAVEPAVACVASRRRAPWPMLQ
ncbi:hypothetical protein [Nannocystis pusilla]